MISTEPYRVSEVDEQLQIIRTLLPDAVGIRNDPLVSSRFTYPAVVRSTYVEMETGKSRQIRIPEHLDEEVFERSMPILAERFELDEEAGRRFMVAAHALQNLNNIGAWPLRVSEREEMVATEVDVGTVAYEQGNYLSESVLHLIDTLDRVDHLQIRYADLGRGGRWRAWVSFQRPSSDLELASIDTSAIALHLEAMLTRRPMRLREINVTRVEGWAAQLGCSPTQIPKILHLLSLFVANLSLTGVELAES